MANAGLGRLFERITIEQSTPSTNTQGGQTLTWSTLAQVWAAVRPLRGAAREQLQAQKVGAIIAHEVEILYRADVTPKMRIAWTPYGGSAKTLEVHGVYPKDGRRNRLLLECSEAA